MGFMDQKYASRSPLSSTGILVNQDQNKNGKRHQTLWNIGSGSSLKKSTGKPFVMPKPDPSHTRKKTKLNKDFHDNMKGVMHCVKDLTSVIMTTIKNKSINSKDAYLEKINKFFKNLDENQRDELMDILLEIIVNAQNLE